MKKTLMILFALGVVTMASFSTSVMPGDVARAETVQLQKNNGSQPYNFTFRLRNEERQIRTQADFQKLLQDLIVYVRELQADLQNINNQVVTTLSALGVTQNTALLRGEVTDFNDAHEATVWFEYGLTSSSLTKKTSTKRIQSTGDARFDKEVRGLRSHTKYYYRAVVRDDNHQTYYGTTQSFTTRKTSHHNEPEVTTKHAISIATTNALVQGVVDMNDFENGEIFFVYGQDERLVTDVEQMFDTYDEVTEAGQDLQKVLVDNDLDDTLTYQLRVSNLERDSSWYYNLCVGYEDGNASLVCGAVRKFTTEK